MKKFLATLLLASLTATLIGSCGANSNGPTQAPSDKSNYIGEEKAKEIALERAGISAEGVKFDRVELDRDDGIWQYEIDFRIDRTEYDVDVKADDGTILSFESKHDD